MEAMPWYASGELCWKGPKCFQSFKKCCVLVIRAFPGNFLFAPSRAMSAPHDDPAPVVTNHLGTERRSEDDASTQEQSLAPAAPPITLRGVPDGLSTESIVKWLAEICAPGLVKQPVGKVRDVALRGKARGKVPTSHSDLPSNFADIVAYSQLHAAHHHQLLICVGVHVSSSRWKGSPQGTTRCYSRAEITCGEWMAMSVWRIWVLQFWPVSCNDVRHVFASTRSSTCIGWRDLAPFHHHCRSML